MARAWRRVMAAKTKPIKSELVFEAKIEREDEEWLYLIDRRG